jgi:hypothetical protein
MKRLLLSFGCVALLALGITSSLQALPSTSYDLVFYSDDTFDTPVGERYSQCGGGVESWGVRSPYPQQTVFDCQTFSQTGCNLYTCQYCPDDAWNIGQCTGCVTFADC